MGKNNDSIEDIDNELLENRVLFLSSDITEETSTKFLKSLMVLQQRNKKKPIHIMINSYGGSLDATFAIYDAIRTSKCPIHTYAQGVAMSGAAIVLMSGTKGYRYAFKNSRIMLHEYSEELEDERYSQHRINMEEGHIAMDKMVSIIRKHTKLGKKKKNLVKLLEKDQYYSPKQAKQYGIIDKIL